jgi:hypothetical protein
MMRDRRKPWLLKQTHFHLDRPCFSPRASARERGYFGFDRLRGSVAAFATPVLLCQVAGRLPARLMLQAVVILRSDLLLSHP